MMNVLAGCLIESPFSIAASVCATSAILGTPDTFVYKIIGADYCHDGFIAFFASIVSTFYRCPAITPSRI